MTDLEIDTDLARGHAKTHDTAAEDVTASLNMIPSAVDGGVAAEAVAGLIAFVAEEAGAFADVNTVIASTVRDIAAAVDMTDDEAQAAMQPLASGLSDL